MAEFSVDHIDHIELFVPDQYKAAAWYERVLGLKIIPEFEKWAATGPLMISSDGGTTMIALFKGQPQKGRAVIGLRRLAFRVTGEGFLDFLRRLDTVAVFNEEDTRVTATDPVDHGGAISIYFCDPWGTPLEITTYQTWTVRKRMRNE